MHGIAVVFAAVLAACSAAAAWAEEYRISTGDQLRIVVFGEDALSGEYEIDGAGGVALPLIGLVEAAGLTVREFETRVADGYRGGYLRNPRVSVEILNFRPFYVLGEVNSPGSFSFRSGMTLLNAVAMAGGFTYRADEDDIELTRGDRSTLQATIDTIVMPGDVIRIGERLF